MSKLPFTNLLIQMLVCWKLRVAVAISAKMFFLSSVNLQIFEEKIPNKESWLLLELDDGKLFFKPNESIQNCVAYVRNWYFRPNPKFSAKLFFFSANSLCLRLAHIIFQMLSHSSLFETLRNKQVVGQIQKVCNYTSTYTRANHAQVVLNQP